MKFELKSERIGGAATVVWMLAPDPELRKGMNCLLIEQ
jgi:hypothetical protein